MAETQTGIFISVVLCTYNRSDLLKGCLESLCAQTLDKSHYEIIVVDNNSSDNTFEVTREFLGQENLRYMVETTPGLSHARNRGLREAQGKYVAYLDDDARAADTWLEVANNALQSIRPELDCLGGPYRPFYTTPKPEWFLDQYEIRGFGDSPRYLKSNEYISGSNMIWAKESLHKIGGFNVNTGVIGNQLRLGEETNAIDNLWQLCKQPQTYYSPDLIIYHLVPDYKMTVPYRLKRKFAEGQYQAAQVKLSGLSGKLIFVARQVFQLFKASLRFLWKARAHSHWQNWVVEDGARISYSWGCLLGVLGFEQKIAQKINEPLL
jgi:glycosyltransferase involved in cell wall biosynthesis